MGQKEFHLISDEISEDIIRAAEELVKDEGAKELNVRKILNAMGITNRVFYNRFRNVNEILEILYTRSVEQMHESVKSPFDIRTQFWQYVMDVATRVLVNTYEVKMQFSQFMFELDSVKEANRDWWTGKIQEIIQVGKEIGEIKDVDAALLSQTIWSFFRGYNADAVSRKLSKEDAVKQFRFGMECLMEGIQAEKSV